MNRLIQQIIGYSLLISMVALMLLPDSGGFVSPEGMISPEGYVYASEPKAQQAQHPLVVTLAPKAQHETQQAQHQFKWNYNFSSNVHEAIKENFDESEWLNAEQVIKCESSGNAGAQSKTSTAGGLFQILDGTWNWLGCDGSKYNAFDNAKCGANLHKLYGWGSTASWNASKHCHNLI